MKIKLLFVFVLCVLSISCTNKSKSNKPLENEIDGYYNALTISGDDKSHGVCILSKNEITFLADGEDYGNLNFLINSKIYIKNNKIYTCTSKDNLYKNKFEEGWTIESNSIKNNVQEIILSTSISKIILTKNINTCYQAPIPR